MLEREHGKMKVTYATCQKGAAGEKREQAALNQKINSLIG